MMFIILLHVYIKYTTKYINNKHKRQTNGINLHK